MSLNLSAYGDDDDDEAAVRRSMEAAEKRDLSRDLNRHNWCPTSPRGSPLCIVRNGLAAANVTPGAKTTGQPIYRYVPKRKDSSFTLARLLKPPPQEWRLHFRCPALALPPATPQMEPEVTVTPRRRENDGTVRKVSLSVTFFSSRRRFHAIVSLCSAWGVIILIHRQNNQVIDYSPELLCSLVLS